MHIRKYFKNPHQSNRSRAGWKQYVWMRNNQTCGASIASCSIGMSRECEVSAVGSCTEASGWRFESVSVPCDVPRQLTSSTGILTSPRFAQSKPERRSGLQFTYRFELSVVISE